MAYSLVKIGTIWLTDDETETGDPCRVILDGLSKLRFAKRGQNVTSADGTPYLFMVPNFGQGIPLTISVTAMLKTALDNLYTAFNAMNETDDLARVIITGPEGDFDLQCQLDFQVGPITYDPEIIGDFVRDVKIYFRTNGYTP